MMVLQIVHPANSLVNGARQVLEFMNSNVLLLNIVSERENTERIILPFVISNHGDEAFPPPNLSRTQLPVLVCFLNYRNVARGQLLGGTLEIDLLHKCFIYVHFHETLPRKTDPSKITLCVTDDNRSSTIIVYRPVLSDA